MEENLDKNLEDGNYESLLKGLLGKTLKNLEEERELSLERYRRQDETINDPDDFILQGKFAVDYLKVAADRSNAMIGIAKMIKDIVYKDGSGEGAASSSNGSMNDAMKREIFKYLQTGKKKEE
jgi:hypothetical protein